MDSNISQNVEKILPKMPKEKIYSVPSEYLTIGLVALFVFLVFGGIFFIAAKFSSDSITTSVPLASGTAFLTQPNNAQPVPNNVPPPQMPAGPLVPSIKPKATPTPTPKPTSTPTVSPTTSPTPTPSPSSSSSSTTSSDKTVNLSMATNPSSTISNGNQITVSLNMSTGSGKADAVELHVKFDQNKLAVQSFTVGSFMSTTLASPAYDNSAGTASVTLGSGFSAPASGTGTLATIVFKTIGPGTATINYDDSSTKTASSGTNNLITPTAGTTITIN